MRKNLHYVVSRQKRNLESWRSYSSTFPISFLFRRQTTRFFSAAPQPFLLFNRDRQVLAIEKKNRTQITVDPLVNNLWKIRLLTGPQMVIMSAVRLQASYSFSQASFIFPKRKKDEIEEAYEKERSLRLTTVPLPLPISSKRRRNRLKRTWKR